METYNSSNKFENNAVLELINETKVQLFFSIYTRTSRQSPWKTPIIDKIPAKESKKITNNKIQSKEKLLCVSLYPENLKNELNEILSMHGIKIIKNTTKKLHIINKHGKFEILTPTNWKIKQAKLNLFNKSMSSIDLTRFINYESTIKLSKEEKACVKVRETEIFKKFENFLQNSIELKDKKVPRIALCLSGGGYRAIVACTGAFRALEEIGLLDCISYIVGLSGSCITLGTLYSKNYSSMNEYSENMKEKLTKTAKECFFDKKSFDFYLKLRNESKKYNTPQSKGINLFTSMISSQLLSDIDRGYDITFSDIDKISHLSDEGKLPIPIFTASFRGLDDNLQWMEFTPWQIGSDYLNNYIPSYYFNSVFENGCVTHSRPNFRLNQILALTNSAFCLPISRLTREIFFPRPEIIELNHLKDNKDPNDISDEEIDEIKSEIEDDQPDINYFQYFIEKILSTSVGEKYLFNPSTISNFTKGIENSPLKKNEFLYFFDAGLNFRLPFPPLFRKQRDIDIIICFENSSPPYIDNAMALKQATNWAYDNGIELPDIDFSLCEFDDPLSRRKICVFEDKYNSNVPTIIYIALQRNDEFSNFDPIENARSGGYCSTTAFGMTPEHFDELSGLTQYTVTNARGEITSAILNSIAKLNNDHDTFM